MVALSTTQLREALTIVEANDGIGVVVENLKPKTVTLYVIDRAGDTAEERTLLPHGDPTFAEAA